MNAREEVQRLIKLYGTQATDAANQRAATQVLSTLNLNGHLDLDYLLSEEGRQMIRQMVREVVQQ